MTANTLASVKRPVWQRLRDVFIFPAPRNPELDSARRLAAFLPLGYLYGVEVEVDPIESPRRHEHEE